MVFRLNNAWRIAARSHANSYFEKVHLIGHEKMEIYVEFWNVVGFSQMLSGYMYDQKNFN